jgi:hypothetical protein
MSNENSSVPQPPANKPRRVIRFLKRIFLFLLFLIVLIVGGCFIIGYYYQDDVKNYIVTQLNKELNTEIIIDGKDIDFTVLKNFPLASVEFKNVKALDATSSIKKDTLFKAQNISLLFNIVDVFNKKYRIKKIMVEDVILNIRIDKLGNDNYHFWKSSSDKNPANFSFALEKISLKKIQLQYNNDQTRQYVNLIINKSTISGKFSNEIYSLDLSGDVFSHSVKVEKTSFLRKKNIHLEFAFDVDNTQKLYVIKKGKLAVEDSKFEVIGNIRTDSEASIDAGIKGKDLDIRSVLSLIPPVYKEKIDKYRSNGEFYFNANIKGTLSGNKMPQVIANFGINNADITQTTNNISLKNVSLKGSFTNGKKCNAQTSVLTLTSVSASLSQGMISGELTVEDFNDLFIHSKIKTDIALEELQRFMKFDTIENISGALKLDVMVNGKWNDLYAVSAQKSTVTGSLQLMGMDLKIKNNKLPFTGINGNFNFDNNNLLVSDLSGNLSNSDFQMKGEFKNIIGFLLKKNETLLINALFNSENMDFNQLLEDKTSTADLQKPYKLKISEYVDFNLNCQIAHLIFRKFEATAIKGTVKMKNKKIMMDSIAISTMNGSISTSGIIDGNDSSRLMINCVSQIKNINVTKMFTAFENFGQTTVTDKNIKGIVTANIQLQTPVNDDLNIDLNNLFANIDMTIEKGELNNVASMKNLSRFIDLQELMNVRFSTLKNQFEVKNKVVTIPKMEINSNAINLSASGTHSFDNNINYKIKLTLDELLFNKAKNNKKENDDFGEVAEDDRKHTNIFLSMTGTVENPVIRYDTKEAIQQFKNNIKTEKQTVKGLLKEEFGFFKKDTTLKSPTKKPEPKFKIEWKENNTPPKAEKKEITVPKKPVDNEDF